MHFFAQRERKAGIYGSFNGMPFRITDNVGSIISGKIIFEGSEACSSLPENVKIVDYRPVFSNKNAPSNSFVIGFALDLTGVGW
jgi:hypothetical protein